MWQGKAGPCTCYFCRVRKPHPDGHASYMTVRRGHLQVAESLDPNDIVPTVMCSICTHEVRKET